MDSAPFTDVRSIIAALGGRREVSAFFRCKIRTVAEWEVRNQLPAKNFVVIRDRLGADVVAESLFSFARI